MEADAFAEQVTPRRIIWTVGHSNLSAEAFMELLAAHSIELVADVRRFPGSRRWPHFGAEPLAQRLGQAGIEYRHFEDLGGRRNKRLENSPNTAWRVEAFNAYADHMASPEFSATLDALEASAAVARTALLCAEALPWRCHRRLIADALVARGWTVLDIMGRGKATEHKLPDFARVVEGGVTYPGSMLF
jgi:uncharacterized protein (DUF488 family)